MMNRNLLVALLYVGIATCSNVIAEDYGRVEIEPKNARVGTLPQVRNPSTKPGPEWVRDPSDQSLGLWDPSTQKFIVVFTPSTVSPQPLTGKIDYGTASMHAKNPRSGAVPKPNPNSTQPPPEWVKETYTRNLGLWSPTMQKFLVVFVPATPPANPIPEPPLPVTPVAPQPAT